MKNLIISSLCLLAALAISTKAYSANDFGPIEATFKNIPDSQRLGVYWYWLADNISKEGVVRDLQAMKRAGINRACIGNIGDNSIKHGNVKIFTDEWWDILHTTLKTAGDLGIEIGVFNSPGWSQSGGPWVKPEQSMRYLASAQMVIDGGKTFHGKIPDIEDKTNEVNVIAYPYIAQKAVFKPIEDLSKAYDIHLVSDQSTTVRSISVQTVTKKCAMNAELFVKDGDGYKLIKKFRIERNRPSVNVGFWPYAPVVISIPEITGKEFRLVIDKKSAGMIASVNISDMPVVERFPEKTLAKMFPSPHPMWDNYMWEVQPESTDASKYVNPKDVIDITDKVAADGTLTWKAPKGKWVIMHTAMKSTGQTNVPATLEATGLEIDKMSARHVASHFDAFLGEILRRIPPQDRRAFKVVVEDSYETGGLNWTDGMAEDFTKRYGYSPIPYLPTLQGVVVGSEDLSDRFLWDLRRLIADKVSYEYVGGLRKVSNAHGLTTWLENYGHWGFPGEFLQYGGQSDEVGGEFWSSGDLGSIENRAASSCSHIYGKPKTWAESFTSSSPDFSRYPGEMKKRGDRFFTEGINATQFHLYIEQPDEKIPGINAWFGNEFNRHNTWFSQLDVFVKYLKRCNYILQQGRYVAEVAYFIGEDAPKMTGITDPELPKGYSFDYVNAEVLLNNASVDADGQLTLKSGMKYHVLVLPPQKTIRPEVLNKIKEFAEAGLTIVGEKPELSPSLQNYPEADKQVKAMADEMWANCTPEGVAYGKGRIYPKEVSLQNILSKMNVMPDFISEVNRDSLLFIHRHLTDGDIYFISNQMGTAVKFNGTFRVSGMVPELWNPQTTETRDLPAYNDNATSTEVPLQLQPYESAFIVFRKSNKTENKTALAENYPTENILADLSASKWNIKFQEGRGVSNTNIQTDSLFDWINSKDEGIKHFSGTAVYTTTFKLKKEPVGQVYADLGKIMVMGKVSINGVYVGGAWTYPYRVNITDAVKKGKNIIEVEAVNDWRNRLIYEKSLPEDQRFTYQTYTYLKKDSPLQSSGLLGPVKIISIKY